MIAPVGAGADALRTTRADWLALAIVVAGAIALRVLYLGQPMRYDEAYSYLYFAQPSLRVAVSDYSVPNNHIFHTVLVWATTRLFGNSPEAIRIPVLLAGVASVPAAWLAARALASRGAAIFAAAAAAVLPSLILYSTNARAYMLVCLATLVYVWLGSRLLDGETRGTWIAIVVIGALEMWAAPIMLYPLGVLFLWLLAERARTEGMQGAIRFLPRVMVAGAVILLLTVVLYLPVILHGEGSQLLHNRFVKPVALHEMRAQLLSFARAMRELIWLGLSRTEVVAGVLVALVGVAAPGPHRARRVTLALSTAVWCGALILATRRLPPPRVLMFLASLWAVYLGIGLSWLAARVRVGRVPVQAVLAIALFALLGVQVVRSRAVLESEETDWIGMRDAREVAALVVSGRDDDRVVINRSSGPPLDYYLYRLTGRRLADFSSEQRRGRVLLVLDERHGQTLHRLLPMYREVVGTVPGTPTLLRQFPGASVYAIAAETP